MTAKKQTDPTLRILGVLTVATALIIGSAIILMAGGWEPGKQEQIARDYRAHQHKAVFVVADKPSVEIRP